MIALFGVAGQSAAYAAREPMPCDHMSMADCMKMMEQSVSDSTAKPAKHKDCTPADCLNYMIACAGITAAIPDTAVATLVVYDRSAMQRPGIVTPLRGRSPPPDIQPPIA
ncbi:hypothetical protein AX777_20680 [Sphingobium yanoikuyae]|uniref:Uncharacterized protein n=2 Tax=Sphingobium yanoikuyae TaxID=13690 RepID=A0A177JUX8_SPHYA|nr:hypothetical protein AX777_20680 [Sphingobium yanoikuyae]